MRFGEVFQILLLVYYCSCKKHKPSGPGKSPVNIETVIAQPLSCGPVPLVLQYDLTPESTVNLSISANTVRLMLDRMEGMFALCGGPLNEPYTFYELHFHWGPDDLDGSEHTINEMRFSMEAHFVFYKLTYGSKIEAMKHKDGLAVLAVFLQGGYENKENFQPVVDKVKMLRGAESKRSLAMQTTEAFGWLMDKFPEGYRYFTYYGSLTTPPYTENVQWIIFDMQRVISSEQVQAFRELKNSEGVYIKANNRPLQSLQGRAIYYSHDYLKFP